MKLSEAIVLGSLMKPKGYGYASFGTGDATCALAAAVDATGWVRFPSLEDARRWPWIERRAPPCPHTWRWLYVFRQRCSWQATSIKRLIWHLNDIHDWPRETIATFIATLEPEEAPDAPATPESVSVAAPEPQERVWAGVSREGE